MSEKRNILALVVITFCIAIASTQIGSFLGFGEGEAVVTQYTAVFRSDGTLEETFTYKVNAEDKRFLYRYWEAPLFTHDVDYPHIELLDVQIPSGTFWYLLDGYGDLYASEEIDPYSESVITTMAYVNEAGAFNPSGFEPGEYTVKYIFKIVPPLEYDNENTHMNIMLASNHIPYQNVRVEIEDTGLIEKVYPHPPTLKRTTDGNLIVFTGTSQEDELLEFEFLLTSDAVNQIDGYPSMVEDVLGQTESANKDLQFQYTLASSLLWIGKIAIFLIPIVFYLYWQRVGMENEYVVPPFLSTIPNKTRKPWIVNLVFKRDATDFDKDGFNATMLDLHEKGKIKVQTINENVEIEIINENGLDQYETKVMNFLQKTARDNVIKTEYMENMVKQAQDNDLVELTVIDLKNQYNQLVTGTDNDVAAEYTINGRKKLYPFFLFSLLMIIAPIWSLMTYDFASRIFLSAAGYGLVALIQSFVAVIFPSTLFGFWKDDTYLEKLQWDAFKNHLSDFSQLERYGSEDLHMWGQWLVYGTALGVGEKVAKAMEDLKIEYPSRQLVHTYRYWFMPISTAQTPSMRSSGSGGSGGGGFGGGGGMGGGGGGVR